MDLENRPLYVLEADQSTLEPRKGKSALIHDLEEKQMILLHETQQNGHAPCAYHPSIRVSSDKS